MMARSIGGSRRRRCVCGLACPAAPPSAAGSAAPSPTHTPPAVTQENLQSTTLDIGVFWVGLLAPAVIWALLGVAVFLRLQFEWLLLVATALALSGANIVGYVRCKSDARAKITSAVTNRLGGSFATQAMQSAAGKAFGF